jgi:hypothetical protein
MPCLMPGRKAIPIGGSRSSQGSAGGADGKAPIVAESFEERHQFSEVARRPGGVRELLRVSRQKFSVAAVGRG